GHVVAERRVALLPLQAGAAERDALEQRDIVADLRRLADHHAHAVVDEEATPDAGRGVDLDAGHEATDVRHPPRARGPARVPAPPPASRPPPPRPRASDPPEARRARPRSPALSGLPGLPPHAPPPVPSPRWPRRSSARSRRPETAPPRDAPHAPAGRSA